MARAISMDVTVLFSPTHGFWSDQGWSDHVSQATRLPLTSTVQVSFKSVRNIRRIRLSACLKLNYLQLMRFALSIMNRKARPLLLQGFFALYRCETPLPKDDDAFLVSLCERVPMALLGRLISEHSHYDIYAGQRLDDVVVVPRGHAEPIEKAPLIPPFIEPHYGKRNSRSPAFSQKTNKPLIGREQRKLMK